MWGPTCAARHRLGDPRRRAHAHEGTRTQECQLQAESPPARRLKLTCNPHQMDRQRNGCNLDGPPALSRPPGELGDPVRPLPTLYPQGLSASLPSPHTHMHTPSPTVTLARLRGSLPMPPASSPSPFPPTGGPSKDSPSPTRPCPALQGWRCMDCGCANAEAAGGRWEAGDWRKGGEVAFLRLHLPREPAPGAGEEGRQKPGARDVVVGVGVLCTPRGSSQSGVSHPFPADEHVEYVASPLQGLAKPPSLQHTTSWFSARQTRGPGWVGTGRSWDKGAVAQRRRAPNQPPESGASFGI